MDAELDESKPTADASTVVLEIVGEMSGVDVEPDSELMAELGFDSLGLVELLVALEETLNLPPIDMEVLGGIKTVADLNTVVQNARARILSGRSLE